MSVKTFDPAALQQFTGTEQWYRHGLSKIIYTDGVQYVAESAGAYWLVDEICFAQMERVVRAEEFQCWRLAVGQLPEHPRAAALTCDDGNGRVVYSKEIPFTDFPADEIKFYLTNGTLLLPSEY